MRAGSNVGLVDSLIAEKRFLDAAEVIVQNVVTADFTQAIRDTFVAPKYVHSPIHDAILLIDPKVVVTTNYDDIYDSYCRKGIAVNGYNVCRYYDRHLVADLRSPVRMIVKSHGCVSDSSQIVLSRSQYFKVRQDNASFYRVLDALFVTHTVLFLGYSLADPDIQLVLENANIAAESVHTHYALIGDDLSPELERAAAQAYNITFVKYPKGRHELAQTLVQSLAAEVAQFRMKNPI